jgi:hypothetical protein
MPSEDALRNVLDAYPSSEIRGRWKKKGRKQEIAREVAEGYTRTEVEEFLRKNFGHTRQHAYVWRLKAPAKLPAKDVLGLPRLAWAEGQRWFYLLKMHWELLLADTKETIQVPYVWPVRVSVIEGALVLRVTIRESDPTRFLDTEQKAFMVSTSLSEEDIIKTLRSTCAEAIGPLDLNKGVKALWAADVIDSAHVRSKKKFSVSTDEMDENYLFKQKYPDEYAEIVKRPLFRTHFRWLNKPQEFIERFLVDPSRGEFHFPKFSKNVNGPRDVIREILRKN